MKITGLNNPNTARNKYDLVEEIVKKNGFDWELVLCESADEIPIKCADADAIVNGMTTVPASALEKLDNCKGMVRCGVGVDVIDIEAATKKGIYVCNAPDYCIPEVATHAMSMILALLRKLPAYDKNIRSGKYWLTNPPYPTRRFSELTLGVVSFGNIGRQLIRYAQVFGPKVVCYDPLVPVGVMLANGVEKVELDELYERSDIISLHCPLMPATAKMINKDSIAKMKNGVIFVNVSRGGLYDPDAVAEALQSGKMAAAGLDVFPQEPIKDWEQPILKCENVILTPHVAYDSAEASRKLYESVASSAMALARGEVPYTALNKNQIKK